MTTHDTQRTYRSMMLAGGLILLAGLFGVYVWLGGLTWLTDNSEPTTKADTADVLGGPIEVDPATSIDPASARYQTGTGDWLFIEYIDLECAVCATQHATIQAVQEAFAGTVRFSVKHFPIHVHATARARALAAECAGRQDKFFEFVDAALALPNRSQDPTADIDTIASSLALDMTAFASCQQDQATVDQITADAREAMATGAEGVPHAALVGPDGDIVATFQGQLTEVQLTKQLERLIAQ